MKKISILHVVPSLQNGGIEQFLYNNARIINKDKYEFSILTQEPRFPEYEERFNKLGIKIYSTPTKKKNIFKYFIKSYKIMKNNNFDIIHIHLGVKSFWLLFIAKLAKIKIRICHAHEARNYRGIKKIIYKIYGKLSLLFSTKLLSCGYNASKFAYGKNDNYILVPNSIDINRFKFNEKIRESIRRKYKINNKFCIGHVGRYVYEKNHEFILEIFNNVIKNNSNCVLLLIGNGPNKDSVICKAKDMNIYDKILFIDANDNIEDYYCAMDSFILPSIYEGFPVTAIEAQCSGLPIYLSNNISDEVKILDCVEFIDISDSNKWVDVDKKKISNDDRKKAFLNIANSNYNIDNSIKILEKVYTDFYSELNKDVSHEK